jgi:hypothetical protein
MYELDNSKSADNQVPANARSQSYWSSAIQESWQKSTASIIQTGRLLLQAREELDRDVFRAMLMRLPFGRRTAERLMKVASHPILSNATHASQLPPSWMTLYELTQLPHSPLLAKLEDGTINPGMERKDVATLLDRPKKPAAPPKPPDLLAAWPVATSEVRRLLFDRIPTAEFLALISPNVRAELTELLERQLTAKANSSRSVNLKNLHGTMSTALLKALSLMRSIDEPKSSEIVRKANICELLNALRALNTICAAGRKELAVVIVETGTIEALRNPHKKKRRRAA